MRTAGSVRPAGFAAESVREFGLRALAGGLVATAAVAGGFCAAGFAWRFLLVVAACGAFATLACACWESRDPAPSPELRYGLVGAAAAVVVLCLLAASEPGFILLGGLIAAPIGGIGGGIAGACAARLPQRLLVPVLCLAVVSLLGTAAVAVTRTLPGLSGSYLVAEGPTTAGSAEQLADRVAAELRVASDPLSDAAWEKVASSVVAPREGGRVSIGYDRTATQRRITVSVDGERACVVVRAGAVTSQPGDCPGS